MAVKLDELYKTLDEMREVYRFDYEKTYFDLRNNHLTMENTTVHIVTEDEKTGTMVKLERNVSARG